jgi:hypothetical protein
MFEGLVLDLCPALAFDEVGNEWHFHGFALISFVTYIEHVNCPGYTGYTTNEDNGS